MKKKHQPEPTHGGARPGAGKKPKVGPLKVTKTITVSVEFAEWMTSLGGEGNPGASVVIEKLGRKSPAFKAWVLGK